MSPTQRRRDKSILIFIAIWGQLLMFNGILADLDISGGITTDASSVAQMNLTNFTTEKWPKGAENSQFVYAVYNNTVKKEVSVYYLLTIPRNESNLIYYNVTLNNKFTSNLTPQTTVKFENITIEGPLSITIESFNDTAGKSALASTKFVLPENNRTTYLHNLQRTETNEHSLITWSPPFVDSETVTSYTILRVICDNGSNKMREYNSCRLFKIENIPKNQTSYQYESQPNSDIYVAISANRGNQSSGIMWAGRNFKCTVFNLMQMTCTFKPEKNTTYGLTFSLDRPRINGMNPYKVFCKNQTNETFYNCEIPEKKIKEELCIDCAHYNEPYYEFYYFTLKPENSKLDSEIFVINNFDSVVPSSVLEMNVPAESITSESAVLTYKTHKKLNILKKRELIHEVTYSCLNFSSYHNSSSHYFATNKYVEFNLTDLYPYSVYNVSVRLKVNGTIDNVWSEFSNITFTTAAKAPENSPSVYAVYINNAKKEVNIYWQDLTPIERNGPNLTYKITVLNSKVSPKTSLSAKPMVTFENSAIDDADIEISIQSVNDKGISKKSSKLNVLHNNDCLLSPRHIRKIETNGTYNISFSSTNENITSYTVFICDARKNEIDRCYNENVFRIENIPKTQTSYLYESSTDINAAVSANCGTQSSGMVWTSCKLQLNQTVDKIINLDVTNFTNHIELTWTTQCSDESTIDGYRIHICSVKSLNDSRCIELKEIKYHSVTKVHERKNYEITYKLELSITQFKGFYKFTIYKDAPNLPIMEISKTFHIYDGREEMANAITGVVSIAFTAIGTVIAIIILSWLICYLRKICDIGIEEPAALKEYWAHINHQNEHMNEPGKKTNNKDMKIFCAKDEKTMKQSERDDLLEDQKQEESDDDSIHSNPKPSGCIKLISDEQVNIEINDLTTSDLLNDSHQIIANPEYVPHSPAPNEAGNSFNNFNPDQTKQKSNAGSRQSNLLPSFNKVPRIQADDELAMNTFSTKNEKLLQNVREPLRLDQQESNVDSTSSNLVPSSSKMLIIPEESDLNSDGLNVSQQNNLIDNLCRTDAGCVPHCSAPNKLTSEKDEAANFHLAEKPPTRYLKMMPIMGKNSKVITTNGKIITKDGQ